MVARIVEATVTLVLAYLVLSNAFGFSEAVRAVGGVYTSAVRTLQGRG